MQWLTKASVENNLYSVSVLCFFILFVNVVHIYVNDQLNMYSVEKNVKPTKMWLMVNGSVKSNFVDNQGNTFSRE